MLSIGGEVAHFCWRCGSAVAVAREAPRHVGPLPVPPGWLVPLDCVWSRLPYHCVVEVDAYGVCSGLTHSFSMVHEPDVTPRSGRATLSDLVLGATILDQALE